MATDKMLPDTQSSGETSGLKIQQAGISGLILPGSIIDTDGYVTQSNITWSLSASVPPGQKGTHMSRFISFAHEMSKTIKLIELPESSYTLANLLDSTDSQLTAAFTAFIEKTAPVSGLPGIIAFPCIYQAKNQAGKVTLTQTVSIPATSLCPCSKAISEYGAHNQRAEVIIRNTGPALPAISKLFEIAENEVSSPIYSLLKRSDEKYVTERAYETALFVEDIARNVYSSLKDSFPSLETEVTVISYESIHNHEAWARIGPE